MAFQIKDFASITASILNHARATTKRITDWLPGSVARTIVESPAIEIEELYLQMFLGLREAIPVSTFRSFGFEKLPATYARGFASVSIDAAPAEDMPIPVGTEFKTDDQRSYLSTESVIWEAGENSVRVPVAAAVEGLAYNVSSGAITNSPFFSTDYSISNALIENGRDAETDAERIARFAEFIGALSRGTVPACVYGAKMAVVLDDDGNRYEYVTRVGYKEDPGYVKIYTYSSRGIPSNELVTIGQRIIDGWRDETTGEIVEGYRAGGVRIDFLPMSEREVSFSAHVSMLPGYTLNAGVIQDLEDVYAAELAAMEAGGVLQLDDLKTALLGVTGIHALVPLDDENIVCGVFEALKPGTLTITPL